MVDTAFIQYIIEELESTGLTFQDQKETFTYLCPNEPWERWEKSWYNWTNPKTTTQNLRKSKTIKIAIAKTVGFEYALWNEPNQQTRKRVIKESIQKQFTPKVVIDSKALIPEEFHMTKEQHILLEKMQQLSLEETTLKLTQHTHFLEKRFENQEFVLELLNLFYNKSYYDLLIAYIFPALQPHERNDEIKIMHAHTLACTSTPDYLLSAKLLDSINIKDDLALRDTKTAFISNIRRLRFSNPDLTKEELQAHLETFINHYHTLYTLNNEYHYYPAVNLLYMVKLYTLIFPNIPQSNTIDTSTLPIKTQISIKKDKQSSDPSNQYYAWVSELEIQMLFYKNEIFTTFDKMITQLKPSTDLLQRTRRQLKMFLALIDKFGESSNIQKIPHIREVERVFYAYIHRT